MECNKDIKFHVVDVNGHEPTVEELKSLVREHPEWGLAWTNVYGWAVDQEGNPLLIDSCGNYVALFEYRIVVEEEIKCHQETR